MHAESHGYAGRRATIAPAAGLPLLRWPEQEEERQRLELLALPRLLLIERGTSPPTSWSELEDWVRDPSDEREIRERTAAIDARVRRRQRGLVIDNGVLRVGGQRLVLTRLEIPTVRVLATNAGRVVRRSDLRSVYEQASGSTSVQAFDSFVRRVRRRLGTVGLTLHGLSNDRMLLEVPSLDGDERR